MARFGERLPAVLGAPDAELQLLAANVLKRKLKVVRQLVCAWQEVREQARIDVTLLDGGRDFTHDELFIIPLDDEEAIVERVVRMVTTTITAQRGIAAADTACRVHAPAGRRDS